MPACLDLPGDTALTLDRSEDRESATLALRARITGLTSAHIGAALEDTLRSVAAYAALTEAVLEARAVHGPLPRIVPAGLLASLARDLHDAGFTVRFAPSLIPDVVTPGAGVPLGTRGAEKELREFVDAHPAWGFA